MMTFELSDSAETWSAYPYHFVLNMTYAVEDSIHTALSVRNTVPLIYRLFSATSRLQSSRSQKQRLRTSDYELAFTRVDVFGASITQTVSAISVTNA